jgi:hypothetical protein
MQEVATGTWKWKSNARRNADPCGEYLLDRKCVLEIRMNQSGSARRKHLRSAL